MYRIWLTTRQSFFGHYPPHLVVCQSHKDSNYVSLGGALEKSSIFCPFLDHIRG